MRMKKIPIKYAQGCIAVKEYFKEYALAGSDLSRVKVIFCVDTNYIPCRACIFKSNLLTPLVLLENFDINKLLRSKKALYSRLDCVTLVVEFDGAFKYYQDSNMYSLVDYNIQLYRPFSVNGEQLIVSDVSAELDQNVLLNIKNIIVNNVNPYILRKSEFYSRR